jgi:RHS repeat-associated protein
VTLTKSYLPYGDELSSSGVGASSYGFTGEMYDSTGLIFLRARYYAPWDGRFLTQDPWDGDYNQPMSYNSWLYVYGNPINNIDPTGELTWDCGGDNFDGIWLRRRVNYAEKIMSEASLNDASAMRTYVTAGIAIQCSGTSLRKPGDLDNSGTGPAQISDNQVYVEWGMPIYQTVIDENGKLKIIIRGYGLRVKCPDTGKLEKTQDQTQPKWAAEYMRRRIQLVWDYCKNCEPTDYYIAAALAQNGPGFTHKNMEDDVNNVSATHRKKHRIKKDWVSYFDNDLKRDGDVKNTILQLDRFTLVINELKSRGWYVHGGINWDKIEELRNLGE